MPKFIDLTGQRFGKLVALERVIGSMDRKGAFWRCRCDCGGLTDARASNLRSGNTQTCGYCGVRKSVQAEAVLRARNAPSRTHPVPQTFLHVYWAHNPVGLRKIPQMGFVVWRDDQGREICCSHLTQDATDSRPAVVIPRLGRRIMEMYLAKYGMIPEREGRHDKAWLAACGITIPSTSMAPITKELVMHQWAQRRERGLPTPGGTFLNESGGTEFHHMLDALPKWAQRMKLKPEPVPVLSVLEARAMLEGKPLVAAPASDNRSAQPVVHEATVDDLLAAPEFDTRPAPPRPVLNMQPATLDDLLAAPEFDTRPAPPNPTPAPKAARAPHEIDIPAALDEIRQRMRGTWKDPVPAAQPTTPPATVEPEDDGSMWGE